MSFAEKLVKLQVKNGESNYRLAKVLGVHQTSVANWQNGIMPHPRTVNAIAKHYGVTPEYLTKEDEG